jgi:hypothetical protein
MLDPYSKEQMEELKRLRPEWQPFFTEFPYSESEETYLLVKVPSPGNPSSFLTLYTYEEEVTISFGVWEAHFNEYTSWEHGELKDALSMVQRIENEDLVIVSYWRGEQWLGSRIIEPTAAIVEPGFASGASLAKVLSWLGRHNREVAL